MLNLCETHTQKMHLPREQITVDRHSTLEGHMAHYDVCLPQLWYHCLTQTIFEMTHFKNVSGSGSYDRLWLIS